MYSCHTWYVGINKGLHSYNWDKGKIEFSKREHSGVYKIVKMIIPKGAQYFKNSRGEYVSDQLIWY